MKITLTLQDQPEGQQPVRFDSEVDEVDGAIQRSSLAFSFAVILHRVITLMNSTHARGLIDAINDLYNDHQSDQGDFQDVTPRVPRTTH